MLFPICLLFLLQNPDPADVQEELDVEFVMLDVMAVDKKGRPVTDLKVSDFVVKENRKKVDVSFFGSLDLRSKVDATFRPVETFDKIETTQKEPETKSQRQVQQIVMALDMESLGMAHVRRSFTQLRDYVTSLDPSFDYQIYVYSLEYGAITDGFVSQRVKVVAALDNFFNQHFGHRTDSGRKALRKGGLLEGLNPEKGGPYSQVTRGSLLKQNPLSLADLEKSFRSCIHLSFSIAQTKACMDDTVRDFYQSHYDRTRRVLGELTSLTKKFGDNNNLKTMILVSPGFTISRLDSAMQLYQSVLKESREEYVVDQSHIFDEKSTKAYYRKLLHACVQNRILYHVLDIFNGMDQDMRSGPQFAGYSTQIRNIYQNYNTEVSAGLQKLAGDTGGTFHQSFHLGAPIKNVIEGERFYFQLGYSSPSGKPGKWRKIKVKCKRKGVKLRYRKGYYGK